MSNKVKKPHTIKVAGVSCANHKYRLNVSGRQNPLQLFQVAIPGDTTFKFVVLPHVMSKRDAVAHLLTVPGFETGAKLFLKELLTKYDAKLNKVPGKRGRPKGSKNKNTKAKPAKVAKVAKKQIKVAVVPVDPVPVKPFVASPEKEAVKADALAKLRQMRQAKKA